MRIDRIEVLASDGSVLETYPIEGEIGDAVAVQFINTENRCQAQIVLDEENNDSIDEADSFIVPVVDSAGQTGDDDGT